MSSRRRFYSEHPIEGDRVTLAGAEARHALNVNRLRPGDEADLFDGSGRECRARLARAGRREAEFEVLASRQVDRELPVAITVASAIPRGRRADYLVEKLCELGAAALVPLWCERSVVDPRVRAENHLRKWSRTVIEACKQSGRNRLMRIERPLEFERMVNQTNQFDWVLICRSDADSLPIHGAEPVGSALVIVGPEGGFAPEETMAADKSGLRAFSLGPATLRTETAAAAAVVRVATCWEIGGCAETATGVE